ncbi:uncharacterized protein Z518_01548 [Rhinocladiella mackenziei CBS 650.93]|uniref:Protein N-terminal and lysine N-methyltransferase EFM7 n=1 Tax=Rhinocladiella mackenziei CBS 650.93 TaxID=1442369 RepID=A0A0D2JLX4_9EURO|nr:uncharacterized protein Z518_01548 [Rhinocladiella mackenziei CBS 650.93]KIX10465.1 hypothetical protein Z518_01548 [Rhinocladiella mackenziei CBS 650.93]
MFSSRILEAVPTAPESEDIFSSALSILFTDDTQNSHGIPGSSVTYHSPRFGNMTLRIPAHPDREEDRKLFAHYLWNAGVIAADAIEAGSTSKQQNVTVSEGEHDRGREQGQWDRRYWDVRGKRVLELGAGTALPSLISALSGAESTTITDHPSSPALTTNAIEQNVRDNVLERPRPDTKSKPVVNVFGYTWGTNMMYLPEQYGKPAPRQPGSFDRIILADCLWMPSQHVNLVKTTLRYLDSSQSNASCAYACACALVVAGFHTGRGIVRHFFEVATGEWKDEEKTSSEADNEDQELAEVQGKLKAVEIFEIDVNGSRRPWEAVRRGENKEQAKRWCVSAVLVKR